MPHNGDQYRAPLVFHRYEKELDRVVHGPDEYTHRHQKMLYEIDNFLEEELGIDLLYGEQCKAAALIHDINGPLFSLRSKQVDSSRLRQALAGIEKAIDDLKAAHKALRTLPTPLDDLTLTQQRPIERSIASLACERDLIERQLLEFSSRSNTRALRIAKILRLVFERYTDDVPTCSAESGVPTSRYAQVLHDLYRVVDISADAFNFGKAALRVPADDPELMEARQALQTSLAEKDDYAYIYCVITRTYIRSID